MILREDPRVTRERLRFQQAKEAADRKAVEAKKAADRKRAETKARDADKARRDADVDAKPWPAEIRALVKAGQIKKGMIPDMARLALGHPLRITETDVGSVRRETWVYPGGTLLFFENDVLIGWQRER
jgi:hypothetical protein